jgi:hypothetical protein
MRRIVEIGAGGKRPRRGGGRRIHIGRLRLMLEEKERRGRRAQKMGEKWWRRK